MAKNYGVHRHASLNEGISAKDDLQIVTKYKAKLRRWSRRVWRPQVCRWCSGRRVSSATHGTANISFLWRKSSNLKAWLCPVALQRIETAYTHFWLPFQCIVATQFHFGRSQYMMFQITPSAILRWNFLENEWGYVLCSPCHSRFEMICVQYERAMSSLTSWRNSFWYALNFSQNAISYLPRWNYIPKSPALPYI